MPGFGLDRAACGELAVSEAREWLVTNGLGGFASGTVAGTLTRRYHGLLFAALHPPRERTLLCPKIDAEIAYDGHTYPLAVDRWRDGTVAPDGYVRLIGYRLEGAIPVWTYACGDALVERRVWMERDANRTYVSYTALHARVPFTLTLRAFANFRPLHGATHAGTWRMDVAGADGGMRIMPYAGASPIVFRADRGICATQHVWYRDFFYTVEAERGLDATEDHLLAGTFTSTLAAGETTTIAVADHALPELDAASALARARDDARALTAGWEREPDWVRQLVLAADQFVVRRPLPGDGDARTILAGYHWFGEWGRDTAIALPGLTLATRRPALARAMLLALAQTIDGGMLPNTVPDADQPPEYNTVDAALWFVDAVRRYVEATGDGDACARLFPALRAIVAAYTAGTRYGIRVDPADGLLHAGEPGVQVTWMDAKVGDWVVTPRIGKPVEVNALWISALRTCAAFARACGEDDAPFGAAAERAHASFERFWNPRTGACFDVLDGPDGDDASLRPNQLFAIALPIDVLDDARRTAIVDVCTARLWTPAGLRSLDPADRRYEGHYGGDPRERDGAYHQGTVWTWLAGPFACAHLRVHRDPRAALALLAPCADGLHVDAIGTLAEIADGNAPFAACGAIAQAWSVATILDAYAAIAGRDERPAVQAAR